MKFKEVNRDVLKGYRMTKNQRLIDEFITSGIDCAALVYEEGEYKHAGSVYNSVKKAIDNMKLSSTLDVRTVKGTVYLFRKDGSND